MKKAIITISTIFMFIGIACACAAEPLKAFVSEFNVVGAPNEAKLQVALQHMFESRLDPANIQIVDSQNIADLLIDGSFTQFGESFSFDVLVTSTGGSTISKVFEQGDVKTDFFSALSRMTDAINRQLAEPPMTAPPKTPQTQYVIPSPKVNPTKVSNSAAESYVIPSVDTGRSARALPGLNLEGIFNGVALGYKASSGERDIFVVGENCLRWYQMADDLKLVDEVKIPVSANIVAIDTADLDADGVLELYVSILDRGVLSSRVFEAQNNKLHEIAENLDWAFRGIGVELKSRVIYAQKMGTDGNFFGSVFVLNKSGNRFETKDSIELPRFGHVFNFAPIASPSGDEFYLVIDVDGHPIISSLDGKEIWKGEEVLGGSETILNKKEAIPGTLENYRWLFMEQRVVTLPDGTILIPHNEGKYSFGNNRVYDGHTMYAYKWTGNTLVEKWHSPKIKSYLGDFSMDFNSKEIILLGIVKRPGLLYKGNTSISIKKID